MKTAELVAHWYEVREIAENIFWVREPKLVSFFIFRHNSEALFIDSGLGLSLKAHEELLKHLGIRDYRVVNTHAHCDHIGLNFGAKSCEISKKEWDKYVSQNESSQLDSFLKILKSIDRSPSILDGKEVDFSHDWKPTDYLEDGQEFKFGPWNFLVRPAPGHTCGSIMFHELTINFLFTGDIIYDGKMYLHLKDSDFDEFRNSIDKLCQMKGEYTDLKIWPSHNSIPLPDDFPEKVKLAIQAHDRGEVQVAGSWPQDLIFEEGLIYKLNNVEFVQRLK